MSQNSEKNNILMHNITVKSSDFEDFGDEYVSPRTVTLSLILRGNIPGPGDWNFLTIFHDQILLEERWQNGLFYDNIVLPLNLKEEYQQEIMADNPLLFLLRTQSGKPAKDTDPLVNVDNRAGGNVDLFPLVLGEQGVSVTVPLVSITSGLLTGCIVEVQARTSGVSNTNKIPLMVTMISGHCLPNTKEGTVFVSGIGLNNIHDPVPIKFGMSLSTFTASKIVWGSVSSAGQAANTKFDIPNDDKFLPQELSIEKSDSDNSIYWNAMKRVLVDSTFLKNRLSSIFFLELAGVPRTGKIEVRGRFMAFIDAGVLLQPGETGVTIVAKLLVYNNDCFSENVGPILDLPPSSARVSTRENDVVTDEFGRDAYIVIRFDLIQPLVPKAKILSLFDLIGLSSPTGIQVNDDQLKHIPPEEPPLDKHRISKEGGALLVHKELSNLNYKTTEQMNKSIKRTAANRLLIRVRSMLKRFTLTDCSQIDYQDAITNQHSVTRRAVTASFAPQIPKVRPSPGLAAARCRLAGDTRISKLHTETNLKISPDHPRVLLSKVLRCLEENNESEAFNYLLEALKVHPRNRYLLWTYGGMQFDKGSRGIETSAAAFRIAVKGDSSDGTTNAIGWAALHALYHFDENVYAAFVAAKKMRKSCELPREWRKCLKRWIDSSGEEETFWIPGVIDSQNPLLIAAAFFLCLRCFKFSERILQCIEDGCAIRGTSLKIKNKVLPDIYYLRTAAFMLRRRLDEALEVAEQGIKILGPCAILSQIRATCLAFSKGWDGYCEDALIEADHAGAEPCPALLLQAALGGLKTNLDTSLQRAARAHKIAPSAHSALIIGRIFLKMGEEHLAERWAAVAVKTEPLLSDGWAFLAMLAMYKRNTDKAKALLLTAKQAGPWSSDIDSELNKVMKVINIEDMPVVMAKNLCLCDYY